MAQPVVRDTRELYIENGFWRLRRREQGMNVDRSAEQNSCRPLWIGPATGPDRLSEKEAEQIARENFLLRDDRRGPSAECGMTIAQFVRDFFVPEHVVTKKPSGRTHYEAILKHVLTPNEVDRIFRPGAGISKTKLKPVPNWPYFDNLRLCDAGPSDVENLLSAALSQGYSTQTARHIRNVVSAIFAHAQKKHQLTAENPTRKVKMPAMIRKEAHVLTLPEAIEILRLMPYPKKEMVLTSIFTGMNMAEICGLQWKCVNLSDTSCSVDGEPIPPRSVAVRKQWGRGALDDLTSNSRKRNLPIPEPLIPVLAGMRERSKFTGPDDFLFASPAGRPLNAKGIAACRLKTIGERLEMPWLSWRVFQRTHKALVQELGMQSLSSLL